MKPLAKYPSAIAMQKQAILEKKDALSMYENAERELTLIFKTVINDRKELKNADMRAAALADYKSNDDNYMDCMAKLRAAQGMVWHAEIALEQLVNEFAVAKIEARQKTAETYLEAGQLGEK